MRPLEASVDKEACNWSEVSCPVILEFLLRLLFARALAVEKRSTLNEQTEMRNLTLPGRTKAGEARLNCNLQIHRFTMYSRNSACVVAMNWRKDTRDARGGMLSNAR